MDFQEIGKPAGAWRVIPNLANYEKTRQGFTWEAARAELSGLPGGRGLNIAHEAVDRHAAGARRDHLALRWLGKKGEQRDFTYADLRARTSRVAGGQPNRRRSTSSAAANPS